MKYKKSEKLKIGESLFEKRKIRNMQKEIHVVFPRGSDKTTLNIQTSNEPKFGIVVLDGFMVTPNLCSQCNDTLFSFTNIKYVDITSTSVTIQRGCEHAKHFSVHIKID